MQHRAQGFNSPPGRPKGNSPPWGAATRAAVERGGFTLIELLVAISIMALMTVLAWRGLDGMQDTTQTTRAHGDAVLTLEGALSQWGADLDAMVAPGLKTGDPQALDWDARVLRITRRHATDPGAGLVVVAWTRSERDGVPQWLRWQSAPLRSRQEWRAAWDLAGQWAQGPSDTAKRHEIAIVALAQWQVYYFRGGAWSNPLSSSGVQAIDNPASGPTPPPAPTGGLPDGIRLVLNIAAPHPLSGTITRDWARPTLTGSAQ